MVSFSVRAGIHDLRDRLASGHVDRILEIDLRAIDYRGELVSAGWNPFDLTVVPARLRRGRIDTFKGMLSVVLFPDCFGVNGKSSQMSTVIRKSFGCLLRFDFRFPAEWQTNIFCIENLLLDDTWRELAAGRLPVRDQKW